MLSMLLLVFPRITRLIYARESLRSHWKSSRARRLPLPMVKRSLLKRNKINSKLGSEKCDAELAAEEGEDEEQDAPTGRVHKAPLAVPPTPPSTPADASFLQTNPVDAAKVTAAAPALPEKPKIRHEWFQTATHVTVEVFVKGRKKEQVKVDFQARALEVVVGLEGGTEYQLNLDLADEIVPAESKYEVLSTKIEIKLKKTRPSKWEMLEAPANQVVGQTVKAWDAVVDEAGPTAHAYPSSARQAAKTGRDWDKLAKESGADEEEKLEGDAALNKVFAGIYKNASDEQRQAMLKSFQESGGTVLSTNWEEVGKGEVKGSPPNGMEMKKWKDLDH